MTALPDLSSDTVLAGLDAEIPDAVELRHELHRAPEISGAETWTASRVAAALGRPEAPVVAGTGRLVRFGAADQPCVALRAELDALPVTEETGAAYASGTGRAHACGHDVHLAGLVAFARALVRVAPEEPLLAVLQPREETQPSGAYDIVQSGALTKQRVRAIVGVHVQPQLPAGSVAADAGVVNAASDEFEITITGSGGHGGYPHLAHDPVPVLCLCLTSLQELVRQAVDPMRPAVVTVGELHAGGAPNVIAETARARGTIRTFDDADRDRLLAAIRSAVRGYAEAHGCAGSVRLDAVEPVLRNDSRLAALGAEWLDKVGFRLATPSFRSCGSDDFSHYGTALPSLMVFLGVGEGPGSPMLHDPRFLPPDERVRDVARALAAGYLAARQLD
ncbi:MAG: M20 metallopeptidase family protein [Streptosporangiales bacterium]